MLIYEEEKDLKKKTESSYWIRWETNDEKYWTKMQIRRREQAD